MRSILITVSVLLIFAMPVLAQDWEAKSFYALGTFSLPSGDFSDVAGNGYGAAVGLMLPYNDNLKFRGELGYTWYSGEEFGNFDYKVEYNYMMVPVVALAEYFFSSESLFYGLGGAGLYYMHASIDALEGTPPFDFDDSKSSTEFGITLGGGYQVNSNISIEGRYNIINNGNQVTINAVYGF